MREHKQVRHSSGYRSFNRNTNKNYFTGIVMADGKTILSREEIALSTQRQDNSLRRKIVLSKWQSH